MKKIEIITTQNVVLQYELAPLRDRILAFVVDLACMVFTYLILFSLFSGIFGSDIASLFLTGVFCFYSLFFEFFNNGQTIGKAALRIRVIKFVGGKATFSDYAARWVFRLIDIYFSLGGIASLLVMSSSRSQRIGDLIANTAVVKTIPTMDIGLSDLLSMHESNVHVPKYPQAKKLQEDHALLIKATLERYRKYQNDSHKEAVIRLSERIGELLGIEQIAGERSTFLQHVLQDYIVLSRS